MKISNDVITKEGENSDLIRGFRKGTLYYNLVTESNVITIKRKFWPILIDFAMTSHQLFSNHMIMVAILKNMEFHLVSYMNFGKVAEFQKIS